MTDGMEGQVSFADLGLWFGKTCQDPSPQTTEKTSVSSLRKSSALPNRMPMCLDLRNRGLMQVQLWEMDGLSLGAYTMHSFGESPKDAVESHLSQILQGGVPRKYYLSAMACKGILRRATERGKELPELLRMVLERQSHSKTDADVRGGARESSSKETEPEHCQQLTTKRSLQKVYGISPFESNAMKSDNPHSGIYEADTSRTLGTSSDPTCNQGGMVVVDKGFSLTEAEHSEDDVVLCIDQGGGKSSVSVSRNVSPTLATTHQGEPVVLAYSESGFSKFEQTEEVASLRASGGSNGGGYRNLNPDKVNSLCACDKKGVNNQYVADGKVILEHRQRAGK